jgi:hypothetical protein
MAGGVRQGPNRRAGPAAAGAGSVLPAAGAAGQPGSISTWSAWTSRPPPPGCAPGSRRGGPGRRASAPSRASRRLPERAATRVDCRRCSGCRPATPTSAAAASCCTPSADRWWRPRQGRWCRPARSMGWVGSARPSSPSSTPTAMRPTTTWSGGCRLNSRWAFPAGWPRWLSAWACRNSPTRTPQLSLLWDELGRRDRWLLIYDNAEQPRDLAPIGHRPATATCW